VGVLRVEPTGPVRSLDELFAIAYAMESDALARYSQLAKKLHQRGTAALADIFDRMSEIQAGRVSELAHLATSPRETLPVEARPPWPIPDTYDAAPEIVAQSKLLTPYRALASAVRREERAFAFWSYVAAHAESNVVRQAAEHMALEALEYVSILRRERRQAFHAQRNASGSIQTIVNAAALAAKERQLAELLVRNPALLGENTSFSQTLMETSREAASKLEELETAHHPRLSLANLPADLSNDPLAISELLVEAYLSLADSSNDDDVVKVAQDLAGAAIYRLATLRSGSDSGTKTTNPLKETLV
jgi:rubrerythrin